MMTFILALGLTSLPQVPCSRVVGAIYKFVKRTTIPGVDSGLNLCAYISGANYNLDALQDKLLKNYHPICITFPRSYAVKIH